jgi:addiction module RelE/StbE family toxin
MVYRIKWSLEAIEDVEAIAKYIEKDSEFYAKAVVNRIFQATEKLKQFPKIGRIVPELDREDIRELIIYSYRIIYQLKEKQILIIAVIHGKRLFEKEII